MAVGLEKLERHLDRLERLFSRKRSAGTQDPPRLVGSLTSSSSSPRKAHATIQTFPQPSFIRPKISRMVAREEVTLPLNPTGRARSLPESSRTPPLLTATRTCPGQSVSMPKLPDQRPRIPQRSSSLGPDIPRRCSSLSPRPTRVHPLPELLEFSFPTPTEESEDKSSLGWRSPPGSRSLSRCTSISLSPKTKVSNRKHEYSDDQDGSPISQCLEPDNEPKHTHQDKQFGEMQARLEETELFGPVLERFPVPPLSPRFVSLREPGPDEMESIHAARSQRLNDICPSEVVLDSHPTLLSKTLNYSTPSPLKRRSNLDSVLKEPSVNDFLNLSDDDIADGHLASQTRPLVSKHPTSALVSNAPSAVSPSRTASGHLLLTLCPPLASPPATAAAFEAARLAAKYRFDLVYVVNLWPSHMSHSSRHPALPQISSTPDTPSPTRTTAPSLPTSPVSGVSGYDSVFEPRSPTPRCAPRSRMTGRLLAAYGLSSIMYPFRISVPVHRKVLRTEGWLEYRNENGCRAPDEFARGYSCSFYTGYSAVRGCEADEKAEVEADPADGKRRKRPAKARAKAANRGIVFAAFRLPGEDGTAVGCGTDELEALHHDAEALVDMLIGVHMTERRRHGETGCGAAAPLAPPRCVADEKTKRRGPGSGNRRWSPSNEMLPSLTLVDSGLGL